MRRFVFLFIGVMLLIGCTEESTNELDWETHDIPPVTYVASDNESEDCTLDCDYPIQNDLTEADISDFYLGMSRIEVLEKIGRKHSVYGSGFWIELYNLGDDNALFYYIVEDDIVILHMLIMCSSTECKKLK